MTHPRGLAVQLLCTLVLLGGCAAGPAGTGDPAPPLPGTGPDAGRTVLYRDQWGVAHLYAPDVEGGMYAMGWAQAEDRTEQLLTNLKIALGEYAEVAGPAALPSDVRARLFEHERLARESLAAQAPTDRAVVDAFTRGIDDWLRAHPERVPAWWGARRVEPWMIEAFGRLFLYGWSIDEGLGDLRRGGVAPDLPVAERASNQWAVAPERSASGNALLVIDPHLSWWGPSRFWEVRVHAGPWHGSGVTLAGSPWIGLGHNDRVAWAMTTGGPDTADVFELVTDPARPDVYRFDGQWRPLRVETQTLRVAGEEAPRTLRLRFSHHGPIVATNADGTRAWAVATAYATATDRNAAWRDLNLARDVSGVFEATRHLAMFPQNVMAADTSGDIYYQRTGRVPIRPEGFDWSRPVDGSTSATAWQGFHPAEDLVQILNPEAGYMQNCNIPPDAMIVDSPLRPDAYRDYLYSAEGYGPARSGWINQRGARALELLAADADVTVEEMIAWATDVRPFGVDRWIDALQLALADRVATGATAEVLEGLLAWDGELRHDSAAALHYLRWREALRARADATTHEDLRAVLDPWYGVAEGRPLPPPLPTAAQRTLLADAFEAAVAELAAQSGGLERTWGDVHRVGRDGVDWPVGGGGNDRLGVTTLRTMGYGEADAEGVRRGVRGQTSTQVVELSEPIRSWIWLPVGQSDDPASPHYRDQAQALFSPRRMKPSNWLPGDLAPHVRSRTVLDGAP